MNIKHRHRPTSGILPALPIDGHRMNLDIIGHMKKRRARCECGWVGPDRDTARQAVDQWRDHVGVIA